MTKQYPSGFCLVASVFNPEKNSTPGCLTEVTVADAARLLTDGTHRVATADEVSAYTNRQGVERSRIIRDDFDKVREQFKHIMGRT